MFPWKIPVPSQTSTKMPAVPPAPQHPPFLQVLAARSQRCDEAQDAQLPGVSGCWVVIGYEGYESKAWHTKNP